MCLAAGIGAAILLLTAVTAYFLHCARPNGVLMYHSLSAPPDGADASLYVPPDEFEAQLAWLAERQIPTGFASDFGREADGTVFFTFDDGYADFYTGAFPLLVKYQAKATVFLITGCIGTEGYLTEEQIRGIQACELVEFGSHTVSHPHLSSLSEEDLLHELADSRAEIERITGQPVRSLSYPYGDADARVREAAASLYEIAFTTRAPTRLESLTGGSRFAVGRWGVPAFLSEEGFAGAAGR